MINAVLVADYPTALALADPQLFSVANLTLLNNHVQANYGTLIYPTLVDSRLKAALSGRLTLTLVHTATFTSATATFHLVLKETPTGYQVRCCQLAA